MNELLLVNNPFGALGVHRQSTPEEVRAAYIGLSKVHHPDKGGTGFKFDEISKAYQLLSNRSLLSQWLKIAMITKKSCYVCKGSGVFYVHKGLLKGTPTQCQSCGGAGVLIK